MEVSVSILLTAFPVTILKSLLEVEKGDGAGSGGEDRVIRHHGSGIGGAGDNLGDAVQFTTMMTKLRLQCPMFVLFLHAMREERTPVFLPVLRGIREFFAEL